MDTDGAVIITWPKPEHGQVTVGPTATPTPEVGTLAPHMIQLADALTDEPIVSVTRLVITVDCNAGAPVLAEATALLDEDGHLLGPGESPVRCDDDPSEFRTGTFTWIVAEMRVAD